MQRRTDPHKLTVFPRLAGCSSGEECSSTSRWRLHLRDHRRSAAEKQNIIAIVVYFYCEFHGTSKYIRSLMKRTMRFRWGATETVARRGQSHCPPHLCCSCRCVITLVKLSEFAPKGGEGVALLPHLFPLPLCSMTSARVSPQYLLVSACPDCSSGGVVVVLRLRC